MAAAAAGCSVVADSDACWRDVVDVTKVRR